MAKTTAGFDRERLKRIDDWAQGYVDAGRISGGQLALIRHGDTVYHEKWGQRDVEAGKATTNNTVYRIFSMTKPIASVALMMLWEEGRFTLDREVFRMIPAWRDLKVREAGSYPNFTVRDPARPMQIRDLLTHQAGLAFGGPGTEIDRAYTAERTRPAKQEGTLEDQVQNMAKMPLEYDPGSQWKYSHATDVVGYLVEYFSGQRFDEFLRERIFEPLGMKDTGFWVDDRREKRFAAYYRKDRDAEGNATIARIDEPDSDTYLRDPKLLSGAGGLVSTLPDYLRFCQMLLNQGELDGTRLLSPATLRLMTMNHLPGGKTLPELALEGFSQTAQGGQGFGLGFSVHVDPTQSLESAPVGVYGWGGAASTWFWIDPVNDLAGVWMTQIPSGTYPFPAQIRALTYSALVE